MPGAPAPRASRARGGFGGGLRGRILRLAASERFQAFAARMPLLARKTRREGEEIFDLIAGFAKSQVLFGLVEAGVLERLTDGPATSAALLPGYPERSAELLLSGGVALGLLRRQSDSFSLTLRGAALLGVPGLQDMIRHHSVMYGDLADPLALLRRETSPELARFWPYVFGAAAAEDPDTARRYSHLMTETQRLVAQDTLAQAELGQAREVLDVGGGTGAFLAALGAQYKGPKLHLFDLPSVAPGAASRFREAGLSDRAQITPGSFRDDPLPTGADTISLIRVLYDHSDETVRALLAKVYAALPSGGRLVISEPMLGGEAPTVAGDIYFALYTFCMETGRARAQAQIAEMVRAAGFEAVETPRARRPFVTSLVLARKPAGQIFV
ncbi:MAG: methyltransferase [Pseudomonadota bacterium]